MRGRIAALFMVASVAPLVFCGVASATHVETSPAPLFYTYHGSDGAGAISFTVSFFGDGPGVVSDIHFANRCAPDGSSVPRGISVSHDGYRYNRDGFTVTGSLAKSEGWRATGTVSVVTAGGCNSGTLNYTATRAVTRRP